MLTGITQPFRCVRCKREIAAEEAFHCPQCRQLICRSHLMQSRPAAYPQACCSHCGTPLAGARQPQS